METVICVHGAQLPPWGQRLPLVRRAGERLLGEVEIRLVGPRQLRGCIERAAAGVVARDDVRELAWVADRLFPPAVAR